MLDAIKMLGRINTNRLFSQIFSSLVDDADNETIKDTPVDAMV
jgi:hypothetical protein